MNLRRVVAAGVATTAGVAGALAFVVLRDNDSSAENSTSRLDLAVVGDSFVELSHDQILALADADGLTTEVYGFGGSAICNWDPQLADLAENPPEVLVLSFAGNDIPKPDSCFNDTGKEFGPEGAAEHYRVDLDKWLDRFDFADTEVYVVLPPPIRDAQFEAQAVAMRAMYIEAAEDRPGLHVINSATTLDPEGEGFVATLPCEDWDTDCPPSGEVAVRTVEDGIHLTPAGAERYARAILNAVT
jgi:hypothetical protein